MKTFTFGFDHKHPITGASLARHYIQVPGDWSTSRTIMDATFGIQWARQYVSPEAAGKDKYKLKELEWTDELRARLEANLPETDPAWVSVLAEM